MLIIYHKKLYEMKVKKSDIADKLGAVFIGKNEPSGYSHRTFRVVFCLIGSPNFDSPVQKIFFPRIEYNGFSMVNVPVVIK